MFYALLARNIEAIRLLVIVHYSIAQLHKTSVTNQWFLKITRRWFKCNMTEIRTSLPQETITDRWYICPRKITCMHNLIPSRRKRDFIFNDPVLWIKVPLQSRCFKRIGEGLNNKWIWTTFHTSPLYWINHSWTSNFILVAAPYELKDNILTLVIKLRERSVQHLKGEKIGKEMLFQILSWCLIRTISPCASGKRDRRLYVKV